MMKRILIALVLVLLTLAALVVYLFVETRQLAGLVRDAETRLPLEGAVLTAAGDTATTDAQGRYALAIPRGRHDLSAQADGYEAVQTEVDGRDLLSRTFTLDLALVQNRVSVTVFDAETNQPISSAQVFAGDKQMAKKAAGLYEARQVRNGAAIAAQALGYQPAGTTFTGETSLDLPLVPNTVNLSIADTYTRQPIANARIQVGETTIASDVQGRAVLRRVIPGATVRASAPGYETTSAPYSGKDIQISIRPNTLDGVVTDAATSQPISGTLVYLGNTIVPTNAKGVYHFDNVPAKAPLTLKVPGYRRMQIDVSGTTRRDIKLTPFLVKAIRIPFATNPEHLRELLDMVGKTELNAIVIDVKSEKGRLAWDTQVPLAKQIGAPYSVGVDLQEIMERCRAQNIYCIARLAVFQDTLLATARPTLAIRKGDGTVFTENGGSAWTNPYNQDAWNYNLSLAKEVAALGFDEIQFDYIRFPGRVGSLSFGTENTEETRVAAIVGFLARAQKELRPTGVFISADVFGLTTATDDDQYTGQRLRDLGPYLDYVSPMVYPDVWWEAADLITRGLGIHNCEEAVRCPYEIVYNSYKRAAEKTSTKVRLWLQAYPGRGDFGITQYRLQKKAAGDAGSHGWMFWNGAGTYDPKMFGPPGP